MNTTYNGSVVVLREEKRIYLLQERKIRMNR